MAIDLTLIGSDQTLVLFFFALAIIFGVLEITKIFRSKAVNFSIAFALAFFAICSASFVQFVVPLLGFIAAFFIILFFIAFLLEVFGLRNNGKQGGIFIYGAILLLLLIFGFMNASLIPNLPFIGSGTNLISLIALIFILVIFWVAFTIGQGTPDQAEQKRSR